MDDATGDDPTSGLPEELLATMPDDPRDSLSAEHEGLLDDLLDGEQRALARVLTKIENRADGSRGLLAALHGHAGTTPVLGVTGSPGAGKSTLVDKLTDHYREGGETVGILAVDPSSPYTGGSVLGDRIRMGSTAGDDGVFIRSMSARGRLGGLSMATTDAVTALDAFGMDRIIIETVGAGQNEVDIVETADTVTVVVQPGSGDDVQLLKAGILEIGDIFVVNKADMDGAAQTAADLKAMVHGQRPTGGVAGHHTPDASQQSVGDGPTQQTSTSENKVNEGGGDGAGEGDEESGGDETSAGDDLSEDSDTSAGDDVSGGGDTSAGDDVSEGGDTSAGDDAGWTPPVVETVATTGDGLDACAAAIADHDQYLDQSGGGMARQQRRAAATLQRLLQQDLGRISEQLIEAHGGLDTLAAAVAARETDPYTLVSGLTDPVTAAIEQRDDDGSETPSDR